MKRERRAKGTGCVFKRATGLYAYRYHDLTGKVRTILLRNENGEPITKKTEADKAAIQYQKEQHQIQSINSKTEYLTQIAEYKDLISCNRVTMERMWEAYMKSPRRPDSSPGTLDFYRNAVVPFQKWMAIHHPEIQMVRDVTEEIAGEYATIFWNSGVSERTYNARITSLKMIFRVLLKDDTPFDPIRRKTPRQQSRNAFTPAQLKAISDKIDDPAYYMLYKDEMRLMLLVMLYTGCRGEDAALLKWSYINLDERVITYIPIKTARKRPVPVTVPIAECLFLALQKKEHDDPQWVLPHVADRYQRNPCGISTDITKLIEAAGIVTKSEDPTLQRKRPIVLYSMHSFRHTFCSIAVNAGIPLATIQAIVGHSTAEMTAHYSHISLESKQKAVLALEEIAPVANDGKTTLLENHFTHLSHQQLAAVGRWLETNLSIRQKEQLRMIL